MRTYYVTLDFIGQPAYGAEVRAPDEQSARFLALREAQGYGWQGEPNRCDVRLCDFSQKRA